MLKLPLLALLLSAAPSYAAVVAPSAGARAWSGPVAGAVGAAGLERTSGLGSFSLPRLAMPGADGRLPILSSPQLINPLAETLAQQQVDPVAFAALTTDAKLVILAAAAKATEARLGLNAAELAEKTRNGVSGAKAAELTRAVAEARETSLYLDAAAEASLASAETVTTAYQEALQEARRAFLEDLPQKIAAGAFDGKTLLVRDALGDAPVWRTADGSPNEAFDTPDAALAARIDSAAKMTPGPWSVAEADLLIAAVRHNREISVIADSERTNEALRALFRISDLGKAAAKAGRLGPAATRLSRKGRASAADVRAVEKYYDRAVEYGGWDWRPKARVLATIQTGGTGLPGWERLQAMKRETAARMNRLAIISGLTWVAAMIPMAIASTFNLFAGFSGLASVGLFLGLMSPIFLFCWAIWQRDSLSSWLGSSVSARLHRHFN